LRSNAAGFILPTDECRLRVPKILTTSFPKILITAR